MKLQAIFFDLDGTLFNTKKFTEISRIKALEAIKKLGVKISLIKLYQELQQIVKEFGSNYPYHFNRLIARIPQNTLYGVNKSILISAAVIAYHRAKDKFLKPFPDAIKLLKKLQKTKIIKGIITDGLEVKQAEKILRLGIYQYINKDAIFISDEVGIRKSNPKLFEYVAKKLQLNSRNCIYVGNDFEMDVIPSKNSGFITILIDKIGIFSTDIPPTDYFVKSFAEIETILKTDFHLEI
ncbi:MAG: HAD-IA family hydrolase [Planctomycetota bacterium]